MRDGLRLGGLGAHDLQPLRQEYGGGRAGAAESEARMSGELLMDLVWMQSLTSGTETLRSGIPASEALAVLQKAAGEDHGPGGVVFLRPSSDVLTAVAAELARARAKHEPIRVAHEALGVVREEYIEFEGEVFAQRLDRVALRKELLQLAAAAIRAVEDLEL
jgi:hypothetical protein